MSVVSLLVTNLAGRRYLGSLRQDVAENGRRGWRCTPGRLSPVPVAGAPEACRLREPARM